MNANTKNVHFGYVPKSSSKKIIKIQYHVNEWDRAIKDASSELAISRIVTTRRTNPFFIQLSLEKMANKFESTSNPDFLRRCGRARECFFR